MADAATLAGNGTPMLTVVPDLPAALPADGSSSSLIDQIVREGARQMLAAALRFIPSGKRNYEPEHHHDGQQCHATSARR